MATKFFCDTCREEIKDLVQFTIETQWRRKYKDGITAQGAWAMKHAFDFCLSCADQFERRMQSGGLTIGRISG